MDKNSLIYIKDARFYELFSAKHKPMLVPSRDFYSLTYRFKGQALIQCNGATLESHADCITFMPKHLAYTTEVLQDVHLVAIHFDIFEGEYPTLPTVIPVNGPTLRSLFQALVKKGGDETADFSRMAIFYTILAELQQMTGVTREGLIPPKIAMARELMEKEYTNAQFSIDSLAENVGVSTSYLRREFLAAYGRPPIQYLKELRIRNAKRLLISKNSTVAQTAVLCGYTGTSYFIQDFKRATGESPNRYKQRILTTL